MSAKPILIAFCLAIAVQFALTSQAFSKYTRGMKLAEDCFLANVGVACCHKKYDACKNGCRTHACKSQCADDHTYCEDIVNDRRSYGDNPNLAPVEPKSRKPSAGTFQGTQPQVLTPVQPKVIKPNTGTFQGKQKLR